MRSRRWDPQARHRGLSRTPRTGWRPSAQGLGEKEGLEGQAETVGRCCPGRGRRGQLWAPGSHRGRGGAAASTWTRAPPLAKARALLSGAQRPSRSSLTAPALHLFCKPSQAPLSTAASGWAQRPRALPCQTRRCVSLQWPGARAGSAPLTWTPEHVARLRTWAGRGASGAQSRLHISTACNDNWQ